MISERSFRTSWARRTSKLLDRLPARTRLIIRPNRPDRLPQTRLIRKRIDTRLPPQPKMRHMAQHSLPILLVPPMRLFILQRRRNQSPTDGPAEERDPFVLWDMEASTDLVRREEGDDFRRGDI